MSIPTLPPLPWPYVPGDQDAHSFEVKAQQNFDHLYTKLRSMFAATSAAIPSAPKVTTYPATVIATSESRTNVAYGLLTTHDEVTGVVLPTNGVILVRYQATWQESVANAARASIFIGSNQLKVASDINAGAVTQAARTGSGGTVNRDNPLVSHPLGLGAVNGNAYTGDVTTGQAVGVATTGTGTITTEVNGTGISLAANSQVGGACSIFAAAGTYTISVQFKSSSGSVTVQNRKLWVEVHNYS